MATLYVKNTGSNTAPYDTWAKAATTLATAATASAAGDTIWISNNHAESSGSTITITTPNTNQTPVFIVCGNDAAEPPTALATGATITQTSNSTNINVGGSFYMYGVTFSWTGTGTSSSNFCNSASSVNWYERCTFTSTTLGLTLTYGGTTRRTTAINCDYRSGGTNTFFTILGQVDMRGCSFLSGGTSPTALFNPQTCRLLVSGMDFSNLSAGVYLISTPGASPQTWAANFRNCKMPSSWSGAIYQPSVPEVPTVGLFNFDSSSANYKIRTEAREGTLLDETSIVRTNGASDGVTALAWKMTSTSTVSQRSMPFYSPEIAIWNDTVGLSLTATVEIVSDGASALNTNEVWLELDYLSSSSAPIVTRVTNTNDFVTSATAQTTSTESWPNATGTGPNGSATWQKQKLQITVTPQMKGLLLMRVGLGKASWTIYVDPKATLQ